MSYSLRTLQAALNGAGFSAAEQNGLYDSRPVVLQNYLKGSYSVTSSATLAPIGVGTQASIAAGSQLYIELQEGEGITDSSTWRIEGQLWVTGALVAIGAKVNLIAGDGLQILTTGNSQFEIDLNNTGAAPVSAYGFASATATNTSAVTAVVSTVWFSGLVQVTGYGGLYVQFAQNVSTGTATVVGQGSYIEARAICPLEH